MTICERLFDELERRNLTAYGLCKAIGLNTSATTAWKKNGTDPPAKYIAKISEFLGCSLSYLLTGEETEQETKKTPAPGISENGREMLALYEKLPERKQVLLLGRLQEMTTPLLDDCREKNKVSASGLSGEKAGALNI